MTAELVFVLAALWVLLGLIDAWVLHGFGCSGWRWICVCVLAGPLSLSFLHDWIERVDPDPRQIETDSSTTLDATSVANEGGLADSTNSIEWPRDDPETRILLQGYRCLSDH
jgi:hypothetical protein